MNLQFLSVSAQPVWPQSWIQLDWDRNENGVTDDWRDVETAHYQYDDEYLYLKLVCYDLPGINWPTRDARYKWFIDDSGYMYYSGGNIFDAEHLLFVEDTDHDGAGEMYLLHDIDNDHNFGNYEPWPTAGYASYEITDSTVGGWRIAAPNQIEMYVDWASLGSPQSYQLFWSTDQQNPNLDQSPTVDRLDEEEPLLVHNVAATGQVATPSTVKQGENVTIQISVENKGTQTETFNVTSYFNSTVLATKLVTNLAAGQSRVLTYYWNTTDIPVGVYSIKGWADSSAAIIETNEDDNWCTEEASVDVQSAPKHDVAATSQVPAMTSVVAGTMVDINVTVSNNGDFNETFNITCFYDENMIGYQTVVNLPAETTSSLTFSWDTTGVSSNTYYILAMADSSRVIAEIDETNNNCTSLETVTVYSPGEAGKLFVDKVKTAVVSGQDPPVVGFSTVYEMTIIVSNTGGSSVSSIVVNETISDVSFISVGTPSQGTILAVPPPRIVWDVGSLPVGGTATLTFRIETIPDSTTPLYLNHKEDLVASGVDSLTGSPVSDTADEDIIVAPIIRDVAATSQIPTSSQVDQGDTIAIQVTVENLGNISETFDVTCYYDAIAIGVLRVFNLGSGNQITIPFGWDTTGVQPGTYSITAEADSSYELAETDETNNICTSPTTVKILINDISIISQAPSPTTVTEGENIMVQVVIKNEGTEFASFNVSCYSNETLIEKKSVVNLQPNMTTTVVFVWNTTGVPHGIYFFNTVASILQGEKDTEDNACRSTTSATVSAGQHQVTFDQVGVFSDFTGTVVTIDGTGYTVASLPIGFMWDSGSTHSFAFQSPLIVTPDAKQYAWTSTAGLSTSKDDSLVIASSGNVTATFKSQFYLTVSSPYSTTGGEGWYDSDSIACASVDTNTVNYGNGTRRMFEFWSGDSSGTEYDQSSGILMDEPRTAIANWKTQYFLSLTKTLGGFINPSISEWWDIGTLVPVTAAPDVNYLFDHWELDTINVGSFSPYQVTMNTAHTLHAVFMPIITGGSSTTIQSPQLAWMSLNMVLVAAVLLAAAFKKKLRRTCASFRQDN
ncbi:MAG: hypothetical protein NWF11_01820 [Candidatus Bathyarchaeota archaeon]|nr:hypothetical protein [Candidatus Bathyarchaeota archaeon]